MNQHNDDGYCICSMAGFCQKHLCDKTSRDVELCKGIRISTANRDAYRRAWEEGRLHAQRKDSYNELQPNAQATHQKPQHNHGVSAPVVLSIKPEDVPCEHRGELVRVQGCTTCAAKSNKTNVYQCSYENNKVCTMSHLIHGVKSCQRCPVGRDSFEDAYEKTLKKNTAERKKRAEESKNAIVPRRANRTPPPFDANPTPPAVRIPFTDEPRFTLLFHCYPMYDWKKHVDLMNKYAKGYSRKIMSICVDDKTARPEEVKEAFGDSWEYIQVRNNPKLREVASYRKLLPMLDTGPNDVAVAAHGKGAQSYTSGNDCISWWIEAMYKTVVGNLGEIKAAMEDGYLIAGSFRRVGAHFGCRYQYHYSGTFYAFRTANAFKRGKPPKLGSRWWSTESWPGEHFPRNLSYCVFDDNCGDIYKIENQKRDELILWEKNKLAKDKAATNESCPTEGLKNE